VKICVSGLWHLGTVTAAGLASLGHDVIGLDADEATVAGLQHAKSPLYEPGLAELLRAGIDSDRLRFTTDVRLAVAGAEIVWITTDTPVDDEDQADTEHVLDAVTALFPELPNTVLIVLSSQLPAGSVRELERRYEAAGCSQHVSFACVPENLRLGKAVEAFLSPARIVAGVRSATDRTRLERALAPLEAPVEWMSVESAEMTKHALNAFLAASIAFANEIALVCETVGADAKEVERGLKSDPRIGSRAYLSPGAAFSGGTLARDVAYLSAIRPLSLIPGIRSSNDLHRNWPAERLLDILKTMTGRTIAVWGLTYKPGTDTLRRSASVELCARLAAAGARVLAHDPVVRALPAGLATSVRLCSTAAEAAHDADAVVIATEWPEYRELASTALPRGAVVVDANRFVGEAIAGRSDIRYFTVGRGAP
jgi:UDPglucose 6-dehydrogenase